MKHSIGKTFLLDFVNLYISFCSRLLGKQKFGNLQASFTFITEKIILSFDKCFDKRTLFLKCKMSSLLKTTKCSLIVFI